MPLYLITSPTGKQYVGITTITVNRRMSGHKTAARQGSPYPLHAAIRKYGFDNMVVETLHTTRDLEELHGLEVATIVERNTEAPNGYNLTAGGEGTLNHTVSEEHRKHLSRRMSERWNDPDFVSMRRVMASEQIKSRSPEQKAVFQAACVAYWKKPENRKRRAEETSKRIQDNPEAAQRAVAAMRAAASVYWENPEARAKQAAKTKTARSAQTPERRREIAMLAVEVRVKKRAEHEAYLATLPPEQADQIRAESRAKKSAETKAGRAATTPEQKAASKERYRQAALRRTPEQLQKMKAARIEAIRERIA